MKIMCLSISPAVNKKMISYITILSLTVFQLQRSGSSVLQPIWFVMGRDASLSQQSQLHKFPKHVLIMAEKTSRKI